MALLTDDEYETWLVEIGGVVIGKMASNTEPLPLEKVIYCLWVADYSMRNSGDLLTAADVHPAFAVEGKKLAQSLDLPKLATAFSLPDELFRQRYCALFGSLVAELRERVNDSDG